MSALYAKLQADDGRMVTRQANERLCVRIETWAGAVLLEVEADPVLGEARWRVGASPTKSGSPQFDGGTSIVRGSVALGSDPRKKAQT